MPTHLKAHLQKGGHVPGILLLRHSYDYGEIPNSSTHLGCRRAGRFSQITPFLTDSMQNPYSEDQLIEQPAIGLLVELGWERLDCFDEFSQVGGSPLGRETKSEVVLTSRLRPALRRLNPDAADAAIDAAIEELTRPRSAMSLPAANREIYNC